MSALGEATLNLVIVTGTVGGVLAVMAVSAVLLLFQLAKLFDPKPRRPRWWVNFVLFLLQEVLTMLVWYFGLWLLHPSDRVPQLWIVLLSLFALQVVLLALPGWARRLSYSLQLPPFGKGTLR